MGILRTRWKGLALSAAVVAAVAGVTLGVTTLLGVTFQGGGSQPVAGSLFGGGDGVTPENVSRIFNAPNPFPEVVATVNGESIDGARLAQKVGFSRIGYEQIGGPIPSDSQLAREALDSLIEMALYLQEAKRLGLWPTVEEAQTSALELKERILADPPDSPERQATELALTAQGIYLKGFESNPLLLEQVSAILAIINLDKHIRDGLPAEEHRDSEAKLRAERSFRESLRAEAKIEIFIQ